MKTALLIDANSLVHRAYHALPPLSSPGGAPSNALYGMASILLKLWNEDPPAYAVAAYDRPEPTFRKERYVAYKAHRPPTPDTLIAQLIASHELFRAFGVRTEELAGYEADDIIATLAERFAPDARITILTGDMDALQLVRGHEIVVRAFRRGISDAMTYDEEAVHERYGLLPAQLIDYKALVGDASDNIKGVSGIGQKTAQELLVRYGTLEGVMKNTKTLAAGTRERLERSKEEAALARELVTLKRDVPIPAYALEDIATQKDDAVLERYFDSLGFTSLITRLKKNGGGTAADTGSSKQRKKSDRSQGAMF